MNAAHFISVCSIVNAFQKFSLTSETGEGGTRRARSTTRTPVEVAAAVTGMKPVSTFLALFLVVLPAAKPCRSMDHKISFGAEREEVCRKSILLGKLSKQ